MISWLYKFLRIKPLGAGETARTPPTGQVFLGIRDGSVVTIDDEGTETPVGGDGGGIGGTLGSTANVVPVANGTGGSTLKASGCSIPDGATGALGNVVQTFSNADVTVTAGTTLLIQTGTLSAARTVTLPAASGYPAGSELKIIDQSGTLTSTNWINIVRAGSDTINGGTSYAMYPVGARSVTLTSNGTSAWIATSNVVLNGGSVSRNGSGRILIESFDGVEIKGTALVSTGSHYFSSFGELAQVASLGSPNANTARIGALDVAGTAEIHVCDEAGNVTQISSHTGSAPDWMYRGGVPDHSEAIGVSWNNYTGIVTYQHRETGAIHRETFAEHNARLSLTGARALTIWDWDEVQVGHVARRNEERAEWQTRRAAWEALPEEQRGEWDGGEIPAVYVPKPKPDWAAERPPDPIDAPAWKVKVWMIRQGIDLSAIPAIISASIPAGPEREEALLRWEHAPMVPFAHPLVPLVSGGLQPPRDPAVVWNEILAV